MLKQEHYKLLNAKIFLFDGCRYKTLGVDVLVTGLFFCEIKYNV